MASLAASGHLELRQRRLMLPYLLLAAAFAIAEFVIQWVSRSLFVSLDIRSQGPAVFSLYGSLDEVVRVALVPFALFLAFYLLASKRDVDLRLSYVSIALSIFVGTMIVFLPVGVGRVLTGPPAHGFTTAQALVQSVGASLGSSLNHSFIGFSALFLSQMVHRPRGTATYVESKEKLHGLEDISIVGVVLVAVYVWEYLARAYDAMYPLGAADQVATLFASSLGAGSPNFYTVMIWQQILLLMVLPFALYFLIARSQKLNPFLQGRRIAVILFVWALFLRTVLPYFYIYFVRLFDPNAFPSATLGSTFANELVPANFLGILASSCTFLFLGITAIVFAFLSRQRETAVEESTHTSATGLESEARTTA